MLKWRKLLRNHIKHAARKLGGQNLWRNRAKKDWLCVMCQQEKEQMLELPFLMTNKQILHTHREQSSKNSHISCLFPTRLARRKGIFSGCGWWHADGVERREELNLLVPVCQSVSWVVVCVCVGDFVSLPQFLESVHLYLSASLYIIQPGAPLGRRLGSGKQNTVWFVCVWFVISVAIFCGWGCTNPRFFPLFLPISSTELSLCFPHI